jgi:hypothetical protein
MKNLYGRDAKAKWNSKANWQSLIITSSGYKAGCLLKEPGTMNELKTQDTKINFDEIILPSRYHRSVNSAKLTVIRQQMKLSQEEFARLCGWSQQFQCRLEGPGEHEISVTMAQTIQETLIKISNYNPSSNSAGG